LYNGKTHWPRKQDGSIYIPLGAWDSDDNEAKAEIKAARDLHAMEPETEIEVFVRVNRHDTGQIFDDQRVDWSMQVLDGIIIPIRKPKKHGNRKGH
jgi:hypothetical protein